VDIVLVNTTTSVLAAPILVGWLAVDQPTITAVPAVAGFDDQTADLPGTGVLSAGKKTTITFSNPGNSAATGPLSFSTDVSDFSVSIDTTESTCLGTLADSGEDTGKSLPFDGLAPAINVSGSPDAAVCRIVVIFSPTTLASPAKTGNLKVTSASGATVTVPLGDTNLNRATARPALTVAAGGSAAFTGTKAGTDYISIESATYKFSAVSVPNYSPDTEGVFTITKAVGAPATGYLSTGLSGDNADQFRIVEDLCIGKSLTGDVATTPTVQGNTCNVKVRFAPTAQGLARKATLTVVDPVSGTPADAVTVALTGDAN